MAKAVIMAGGLGERFWPLTHKGFPKYRIRCGSDRSLLVQTYERLRKVYGKNNIYVVTTKYHVSLIQKELPALSRPQLLVEPFRNNTASAITLACLQLKNRFSEQETVSFFPADHLICNEVSFKKDIRRALHIAQKSEQLLLLGVVPTFAATGYGYIQKGARLKNFVGAVHVRRFVEKPGPRMARRYSRDKNYLWNAGMFVWRLEVFFKAMKECCPIFCRKSSVRDLKDSYRNLPNISIDRALMEKTGKACVLTARMDWCDVGNWDALFEKTTLGRHKNHSQGICALRDTKESMIINATSKPVTVLGVRDLIVVQTSRGTLICKKGRAEEAAVLIKKI